SEQEAYRNRLSDARRRRATYSARVGEPFAFEAELDLKHAELAAIEAALATDDPDPKKQEESLAA
ncbi:hypothetical protein, partial [Bacillus cereus]